MGILSKLIGQQKESDAAAFLASKKLNVLQKNFLCKGGEIDLICLDNSDKDDPILIFIEVKHRKTSAFGTPEESINKSKQRKIMLCAQRFLQQHPTYQNYAMRFDSLSYIGEQTQPNWIQNAFWLEEL